MRGHYRDAWKIVRNDLIRFKWGIFMTIVFSAYMAVMSGLMLKALLNGVEPASKALKGMTDFVFLVTIPNFGFFFTRRSMRYMKDDSYTKWIRKLRILPIDVKTVVLSRTMQMLVALFINMSVMLVGQYMLSEKIRSLGWISSISYVLMLIAFAITISWVYISLEVSLSGRLYMRYSFILLGIITVVSVLAGAANESILQSAVGVAESHPWISIVLSIVVIVNSNVIGMNRLRKIVLKRDWI
ncbi:hypothetical protein M5X00_12585 [Paenibacillus alvei]|uniref:ABC-2 family transporter protein n=1 Tax=Paenibacillus alvei TaxID=44250 RepID=A0ABT4GXA1_PAEAL|nr:MULTISPECIES: hypothetical protein [Paenibacillus]EJW19669.1 hypothetical protein PAV_1c06520 [Paenibacillus alvei DSM 29]MCY9542025.1 hypothetical protein [Paenibacillus alvei]MCY9706761.1 hypothetical protein [Paenibacillus alvei]MCY9735239.1 hypothetical protein [Paenibacillus alvei]MCY9755077.1 hypothetical protein [Paenibacillus alvei]